VSRGGTLPSWPALFVGVLAFACLVVQSGLAAAFVAMAVVRTDVAPLLASGVVAVGTAAMALHQRPEGMPPWGPVVLFGAGVALLQLAHWRFRHPASAPWPRSRSQRATVVVLAVATAASLALPLLQRGEGGFVVAELATPALFAVALAVVVVCRARRP
jgi:hypothetical protein